MEEQTIKKYIDKCLEEKLKEYISKYNPILLSAPSRNNESRLGKRIWANCRQN